MAEKLVLNIVTLCGSARTDSYNAALIRALPNLSSGVLDFKSGPSVADIPIYDGDLERTSGLPSAVVSLVGAIREADGVLIATPEHNYSIPGGLKNLLDWVSRAPNQPFAKKPVLIQSVSAGPMGKEGPLLTAPRLVRLKPSKFPHHDRAWPGPLHAVCA